MFVFKKKTAYERRISDWSSDVCSSDLQSGVAQVGEDKREELARHVGVRGDAVHRDRRAAGGCLSKIEHRAERVTGTLRQHDRAMSAHYGASRARGRA